MFVEFLETLQQPWAIRALVASSVVGVMLGVLGCFIVLRNMSLIGDALAHAILPGIYVAYILVGYSTLGFFFGSVIAGMVCAIAITLIQHVAKTKNDAAIGIVFTAMFAIGVMGISSLNQQPGNHIDLKDFLFGNILGISNEDIGITSIVLLYTVACITIFYRYLFITTFQPTIAQTMGISVKYVHYFLMLLLSFAVVAALRTVGVILVVAMLITPAATALLLSNKLKRVIVIAGFIGLISSILGFLIALIYNTTPGPAMTIVATSIYLIVVIFAPEKGLLAQFLIKVKRQKRIQHEDIVKAVFKGESNPKTVAEILNLSTNRMRSRVYEMKREGVLVEKDGELILSIKGKEIGEQLIRAHRLWETYQVKQMGIEDHNIHEEAERLEHLLSEEILDEVDQKLGFPSQDPHGSPIPRKKMSAANPLLNLAPKNRAKIAKNQISDIIESELWELGLLPNSWFSVVKMTKDHVIIKHNQKELKIAAELAKQINIER